MDERRYQDLAGQAFRRVLDLFDDIDADEADVEPGGDVIRISFRGGQKVVVNTQRPTRQIWLAGGQRAWHFDYDENGERWIADKGGQELFAVIADLTFAAIGVRLRAQ